MKMKGLMVLGAVAIMGLWAGSAGAQELVIFPTNYMDNPSSTTMPPETAVREVKMMACAGEYEPQAFGVRSTKLVDELVVTVSDLVTADNRGKIASADVAVGAMGKVVEKTRGQVFQVLAAAKPAELPANVTLTYWLTVHVPKNQAPGTYRGTVTAGAGAASAKVALVVEVPAIQLDEPKQAIGWNYSWPGSAELLREQLADMRAHSMTGVGPLYAFSLPIYNDDVSEWETFIQEYQKAGFKTPLWIATAMNMTVENLKGYGEVDSPRFVRKWKEVMEKVFAVTVKYNQPAYFSVGDEFTNQGIRGEAISERLAKVAFNTVPHIPCASDVNGYQELMKVSKFYDASAFNIGWDGPDGTNHGRHLLNRKTIEEVAANGCKPWFVNGFKGRMPYGYFFWKMAGYGLQGKIEWYYNLGNPPYDRGSAIFVLEGKTVPTLEYERCREGVDDVRYLVTLENKIAAAKKAGRGTSAAVTKAEGVLQEVRTAVADDWDEIGKGDYKWSNSKYDDFRKKVAESILEVK